MELVGSTCEKYGKDRVHDFYITRSFFKDEDCKESLFGSKEFEEMDPAKMLEVIRVYNDTFLFFSEENIQYTILEDFYSAYLGFVEDSVQFFGIPFCSLTYNQIRLIVYSRVFKNIFDQNENIPEKIRADPKALLDYGSISKEEREKMKAKISGDGSTIVGATDSDYKALGVSRPEGGVDLHAEAVKKGGELNMEDLIKLHGA